MKTKLLIAFLAAAFMAGVAAVAPSNLVDIHKNAKANVAKCLSCHSDTADEQSTDPKVKAFHPLHLESPLLKFTCVDCHTSVDVREGSAAKLRKQVDPGLCEKCHSPWSDTMEDVTFVNHAKVTAKDCLGCHGGRALFLGAEEKKGVQ